MKILPFGRGSAQLIMSEGEDILGLDVSQIQNLFKSSGVLIFRGFEVGEQTFPAFVTPHSSQFLKDYGNSKTSDPGGGYVQSVTVGTKPIELHCENGVSAERPDVIWFYCAAPALKGGETTFCDGVSVWQSLNSWTKELFLTKKIKYSITVPRQIYLDKDQAIVLHVGDLKFAGMTYRFNDDESLTVEYVVSAVKKTRYGSQPGFSNSLTGPYPGYRITFADDSEIPMEAMREIKMLHEELTEDIPWQANDLAMIDNSRFLHGRRAFNDKQRRIFSLMSLANF